MDFFMTIILWVLTIVVGVGVAIIVYATWHYGSLEKLGIPVVKPFLFMGSNFRDPHIDLHQQDIDRQRTYGDIYGVYDGRRPQIYISDPKLIRRITTVDFDHFKNHGYIYMRDSTSMFENHLDFLHDEKWETVRAAIAPIFTSAKTKELTKLAYSIGEDYADTLMSRCNESPDARVTGIRLKEFTAPMMIEILGKCFCGFEIPNARDANNEFVQNLKLAFWHELPQEDWKVILPKIFPILTQFAPTVDMPGLEFFVSAMKKSLETREKSGDVSIDATSTLIEMMKKVRTDPLFAKLGIGENAVISVGWLAAGYVGILNLFDFFMYEMAANPEVQEELYAEIQAGVKNNEGRLEKINGLPLLSACLKEAARLHPSFIRPERLCNKDWKCDEIFIRKGTGVVFPMAALHMNPKYFPNPERFDPYRFLGGQNKEMDPYAFLAFGHGPRGCIAQSFALEALQVLIVSFLSRIKIETRSDTICKRKPGGSILLSFGPLYLDVVKR